MDPNPETTPLEPTVWQMMAALASDAYELRMVAPAEFEIVEPDRTAPPPDCMANDAESEMSGV